MTNRETTGKIRSFYFTKYNKIATIKSSSLKKLLSYKSQMREIEQTASVDLSKKSYKKSEALIKEYKPLL